MHNPPSPPPLPPPPPSPPSPSSLLQPRVSEMDTMIPHQLAIYEPSNPLWDWSDFLDFDIDDQLSIPLDSDHPPATHPPIDLPPIVPIQASSSDDSDKVRKRDPRLACSNFLAGRIPCSCPELDEKLAEEEEESGPGKKRARTVKASSGMARCQVPGCEADISELKGYHRRHRVCLRCANASAVVLDGQSKRYCQQCGKFHILSDFDEGKRSCRRKLERHNNRRRRKATDSKEAPEKEPQQVLLAEDVDCDDGAGKDSVCLNSKAKEGETLLESEEHISILCSARGSENIQNDSFVSFAASGEAQIDEGKEKYTNSPSYCENKSALSSMCPTGRISFKLYDWNPAEFPRRLRHQIFQWLSSMPVELEGYIRPGCTILTVFIAMPKFMWVKLFEDPIVYINDLVGPGNMLSGRGTFLVYLNNMIFRVMKDGASVIKVKVEGQAPKLHHVHPTCFEAGKPMEFVACGSNLLQPKFRFLLSFAGKYLKYDVCVEPPCKKTEKGAASNFDHQLLKIFVPHTEQNIFGPAFIEVENESGLSNVIPILIGDKEICSELKIMQHQFDTSLRSKGSQFAATSSSCEVSVLRQKELSEFILHVAWLLKEPASENRQHILTSSQLQRLNCLLDFLIDTESTAILERVLYHMKIVMNNCVANSIANADMRLYQRNINHASDILHKKLQKKVNSVLLIRNIAPKEDFCIQNSKNDPCSVVPATNQNMEVIERSKLDAVGLISSRVPLLNGDVVMSVNLIKEREWPRKSCSPIFTSTILTSRPLIVAIVATAACFGICAVVLHPQRVGEIATTIRRCLFNNQP